MPPIYTGKCVGLFALNQFSHLVMSTSATYKMLSPNFSEIDAEVLPFIEGKEEGSIDCLQKRQQNVACFQPLVTLPWLLVVFCIGYILAQDVRSPSELECTRLLNPYCKYLPCSVHVHVRTNFQKPR